MSFSRKRPIWELFLRSYENESKADYQCGHLQISQRGNIMSFVINHLQSEDDLSQKTKCQRNIRCSETRLLLPWRQWTWASVWNVPELTEPLHKVHLKLGLTLLHRSLYDSGSSLCYAGFSIPHPSRMHIPCTSCSNSPWPLTVCLWVNAISSQCPEAWP